MTHIFLAQLANNQTSLISHIQSRQAPSESVCPSREFQSVFSVPRAFPEIMGQFLTMIPAHAYLLQLNGVYLRMLISLLLEMSPEALILDNTEPLGIVDRPIVNLYCFGLVFLSHLLW